MLKLIQKRNNKKGFTLAELLIVVAIIAVLVAISIPIFTSQLEKSREAVDMANIRSAYAEVSADVLTDPKSPTTETTNGGYKIKYESGVYTATVTAKQTDTSKWTGDTPNIGGTDVQAAASWTVTGTVSTGKVEITPAETKKTNP